jgi:Polyphosphate kinase 2 (PPK2)
MVDSGIILLKYWLEVGQEEQTRRIESRIDDPRKVWKLSPMDLKSYSRWYQYSRARDEMFAATSTEFAPWHVAGANDKKRARLNIISHVLEQIPYESPKRESVVLPEREKRGGYREPDHPGCTSQRSTKSQRRRQVAYSRPPDGIDVDVVDCARSNPRLHPTEISLTSGMWRAIAGFIPARS